MARRSLAAAATSAIGVQNALGQRNKFSPIDDLAQALPIFSRLLPFLTPVFRVRA
jgi:hypothetical protein